MGEKWIPDFMNFQPDAAASFLWCAMLTGHSSFALLAGAIFLLQE